jgi:hypothetical protein
VERRAIIVHDLATAEAAVAAAAAVGVPVALCSAPGAAAYLGAPLFREIVDRARAKFPDADAVAVLDCGRDAGYALAAWRCGIERVRVDVPAPARAAIADIGRRWSAGVESDTTPALDLLNCENPLASCKNWLAAAKK